MKFFISFIFFLFSLNLYAKSIATINFEKIYESSIALNDYVKDIENYKKNQEKELKKIEKNLNKEKKELDSSKIILSEEEFDKKLVNYQENVRKYQEKIDFINNEIYNKFESGKLVIRKEVIKILQDIAIEKNLDIIFDSNDYLIAIKDIDLTGQVIRIINSDLKNINLN